MKNKKILNHFIGAIDDRDEYQQQEIYKELAYSGMLLWFLIMLLMFASVVVDTIYNKLSFVTPALLIINMVYAVKIVSSLRKKHLDGTDCASIEEYNEKKKNLKKSSAFAGIQWGLFMIIFMQYILPYLSTGEIDVSWQSVLTWVVAGIFFGSALYWFSKSKLQKHY